MMNKRLFGFFLTWLSLLPSLTYAMHWETYHGKIPGNAFQVGFDTNNKRLYLCRAKVHGSVQPGKTWRGYGKCNVPYGGREIIANRFSLLRKERGSHPLYWGSQAGKKPWVIGRDSDGKRLFLCQANYLGSKQPVRPGVAMGTVTSAMQAASSCLIIIEY